MMRDRNVNPLGLSSSSEPDNGEVSPRNRPNLLTEFLLKLVGFVRHLLKKIVNFLFNHRYHLDDIISIVRPFIYVYSVMKCGNRSYTPIKLSLALDVISILVSFSRLIQAAEP